MNEIKQNTEEWVAFRKGKVGASDAPIIMGVSPYKTPLQLWEEKMDISNPEQHAYMRRGLHLEDEARKCFEGKTGIKTEPKVVIHNHNEWMMASLDGVDETGTKVVEIKCSGSKYHQEALDGKIPEHYIPQLQHQMSCADVSKVYYFSYDGNDGVILELERDEKYIQEMIKKEMEFFEYMMSMLPPPLSDKDYRLNDSQEWIDLSNEWKLLKEKKDLIAHDEKVLKEKFRLLAHGKNTEGNGVKVRFSTRPGAIDYSQIPELKGIDLERYRKKSTEYMVVS